MSEWKTSKTAPKDGSRFIAWDAVNGDLLFSMHFDGDEFLTDYEQWSGKFTHWMPWPESPEGDRDI